MKKRTLNKFEFCLSEITPDKKNVFINDSIVFDSFTLLSNKKLNKSYADSLLALNYRGKFINDGIISLLKKYLLIDKLIISSCFLSKTDFTLIIKKTSIINKILDVYRSESLERIVLKFYKKNDKLHCELNSLKLNKNLIEYDLLKKLLWIDPTSEVLLQRQENSFSCHINLQREKQIRIQSVI